MIFLIYSGEIEMAHRAQEAILGRVACDVLREDEDTKEEYLVNGKGVMILRDLSRWTHYKKFTTILLVIFSQGARSGFYDDIVKLNKFCYKIRYLNAFQDLEEQISKLNLNTRPPWKKYFMDLAVIASYRSSCRKRNVGALIVKDRRIISAGFNGTPIGTTNCIDGGCARCNSDSKIGENLDLCFCLHAEESAIIGQSKDLTANSTMYVSLFPCGLCIKKIIQARIVKIVFKDFYCKNDEKLIRVFEDANIEVEHYKDDDECLH